MVCGQCIDVFLQLFQQAQSRLYLRQFQMACLVTLVMGSTVPAQLKKNVALMLDRNNDTAFQ